MWCVERELRALIGICKASAFSTDYNVTFSLCHIWIKSKKDQLRKGNPLAWLRNPALANVLGQVPVLITAETEGIKDMQTVLRAPEPANTVSGL